MAVIKYEDGGFLRILVKEATTKRLRKAERIKIDNAKALYLKEKSKTIEAAVKYFKTLDNFLNIAEGIGDYGKDEVARDFIEGTIERFKKIAVKVNEAERAGHGWLHEKL